jgi:hypothetical protein
VSEVKQKTEHEKLWNSFEDSFGRRPWKFILSTWPDFAQKPHDASTDNLNETLSDFIGQGGVLMNVPEKGKFSTILHPRGEIPEIIFREAILWMHKALHVLGASEIHVEQGLPSWSISSAYQSAYFAARSILAFLGVSLAEFQRVSVVVDLCRDMQGLRPQKIQSIGAFEENVSFRSLGVLFDHRQTWLLFKRLLRVSTCELWPDGWSEYFAQLDLSGLTKQRHGLHYQLDYWILDDLHDFVYSDEFRKVDSSGTGRELFDSAKDNYSLIIGFSLARMALLLFNDLCSNSKKFQNEQKKIVEGFSYERHPLFFENFNRELKLEL